MFLIIQVVATLSFTHYLRSLEFLRVIQAQKMFESYRTVISEPLKFMYFYCFVMSFIEKDYLPEQPILIKPENILQ